MKQGKGTFAFRMFIRIFMILCGILVLFPIIWLFMTSLKSNMEFFASQWALPSEFRISNYLDAWSKANISGYFLNSLLVVGGTVVIFAVLVSTNAYILAKFRFRGQKFLEGFYFAAIMIPAVLQLTPLYYQLENANLTDNLFVLMVVYAIQSLPVQLFLITSFVRGINDSFIEAAVIDGATEWQIFTQVVVPLVKPILFFSCLGMIMNIWNEYTTALVFISDPAKYTVSIGLHFLELSEGDKGVLFAGLVIALIPVLVLYGLFQKQIQEGISASDGVKG